MIKSTYEFNGIKDFYHLFDYDVDIVSISALLNTNAIILAN